MSATTITAIGPRPSSPLGTHNVNLDGVDIPNHKGDIPPTTANFSFTFDYPGLDMFHPLWEWTLPTGAEVALPESDKLEHELEEEFQHKAEDLTKYDILKSPLRPLTRDISTAVPAPWDSPNIDDLNEDELRVLGSPYLRAVKDFKDVDKRNDYLRDAYKFDYALESPPPLKRARHFTDESPDTSSDECRLQIFDTLFANDGETGNAEYYSHRNGVDDNEDKEDRTSDDGSMWNTSEYTMVGSHDQIFPSAPQPDKGKWVQMPEWMMSRLPPSTEVEPNPTPRSSKKRKAEELEAEDVLVLTVNQDDHSGLDDNAGEVPMQNNSTSEPEPAPEAAGPVLVVPELTTTEHTQFLQERYDLVGHWADDHVWTCPFPEDLHIFDANGRSKCTGGFEGRKAIRKHLNKHVGNTPAGQLLHCPRRDEDDCTWEARLPAQSSGLPRHIAQVHLKTDMIDCGCGATICRRSRDQIRRHLKSPEHERDATAIGYPSMYDANILQDQLSWKAQRLQH